MYQPQQAETTDLTKLLASQLPGRATGSRTNIKNYGDRFRYMSLYKDQNDFFIYAGQFGHGIVLWGMACREGDKPTGNKLSEAPWMAGGCGAGSKMPRATEGAHAVKTGVWMSRDYQVSEDQKICPKASIF